MNMIKSSFHSVALFSLATLLASAPALPLPATYLINSDLKESIAGWSGDGESKFLKPDGLEGDETDPGAIPVIKLDLSRGSPRAVYQEFVTRDKPTNLHIKVDVFASLDFQRSKFPSDYTITWKPGGTWYWSAIAIPSVDFWIRGGPGWFYKLTSLKPGKWVTVNGSFEGLSSDENRVVNFCVPPGEGAVYLKNAVVTP